MNTIALIALLLVSIAGSFIVLKNQRSLTDTANMLLGSTFLLVLIGIEGEVFNAQAAPLGYTLIGLNAITFAASRLAFLRKVGLRLIVPVLGVLLVYIVFGGHTYTDGGFTFTLTDTLIPVGVVLALLAYELTALKAVFLVKWFGVEKEQLTTTVLAYVVGIVLFMELFAGGGTLGAVLAGSAYLWSSFYRENTGKSIAYSFFALALAGPVLRLAEMDQTSLIAGHVVEGIFLGAAAVFMMRLFSGATKSRGIALLFGWIFSTGLLGGLMYLGAIYAGIGGADAFVGGLIGFALANVLLISWIESLPLFGGLVVLGLWMAPALVNQELKAFEEQMNAAAVGTTAETEEEVLPVTVPLADISGKYSIEKSTALISFQLGRPNALTKGAIKEFTGTVTIGEDPTQTVFDVTLPTANLTTFIAMRDAEVLGERYLKADQFPKMRFKSSGLKTVEGAENRYEAIGQFEMLGVKKEVVVTVERIEEDGKKLLIGSGKLDRREFGMKADDKEGNIVEFTYKIELK